MPRPLPPLIWRGAALALGAAACAAPEGEDRTEPATWLLTHLDAASDDEVAARVEHLDAWARPLGRDAALEDREYAPSAPTADALRALPHADGGPPLIGVGAAAWSPHDVDAHLRLIGRAERGCVEAAELWTRAWTAGGDCFPQGVCDGATSDEALRADVGGVTFDLTASTRWRAVDLADDRRAVVGRAATPEAATAGQARLFERYTLQVWVEDPDDSGSTWRVDATWVGADGVGPLRDALLSSLDAAWTRQESAFDDGDLLDPCPPAEPGP